MLELKFIFQFMRKMMIGTKFPRVPMSLRSVINPIGVGGGTMGPHFFQKAFFSMKKGSEGLKFLDFFLFIINVYKL